MQIFGHFYQFLWADLWTLGQNRGQVLLPIVSGWVENIDMPTSKPEKKEPKKPLSVTHPEVAKEAHGWDPSEVTYGSGKKVIWKCSKGHLWESLVYLRVNGERSCKKCRSNLIDTHPEIASEAYGWDPSEVTYGNSKKKFWMCDKKHVWETTTNSRTAGRGCPFCSNLYASPGINDLVTTHPEIAAEAHGWDPTKFGAGSEKKVEWICDKGHIYKMPITKRIKSLGCVYCSNWKTLAGFNDLVTTHPNIAKEACGWDPRTVTQGSGLKKNWKCNLGHEWLARVEARVNGRGCIYCSNWAVLPGFNDLETTHPELSIQANGWDPKTVIGGSSRKVRWKCSLGHEWTSIIYTRKRGVGCPICSGHKVLPGFNDLATVDPELAATAYNWDPKTLTKGSSRRVQWICPLGHVWVNTVVNRSRKKQGCSICAGNTVLAGFNDLKFVNPEVAKEAHGWDPSTVLARSELKKMWKCAKGHKWTAMVSRRNLGSGCPTCAPTGFDPNEKGFLYLIEHNTWEMFQIGITNSPDVRLKTHTNLGWEVLEIRGPMDGHLTQQWETAILRMLKKKRADLSNEKIAGKFDGYSEAWTKATFPVDSIKELMRLTDEFEESLGKGRRVE